MTNVIATISSKSYIKYTRKLIKSIRKAGWTDKIYVFTEEQLKLNDCEQIIEKRPHIRFLRKFNDSRWLKCKILNHFSINDTILYVDSDIILRKGFNKFFDGVHNISACYVNHDINRDACIIEYYTGYRPQGKYQDCLFAVRKTHRMIMWFKVWQSCMMLSALEGKGTLVAFNIARTIGNISIKVLDRNEFYFTVDRIDGKEINENKILCIHYGGKAGVKHWEEDNKGKIRRWIT